MRHLIALSFIILFCACLGGGSQDDTLTLFVFDKVSKAPVEGAEVVIDVQCREDESFCIAYPPKVYISDTKGFVKIPSKDLNLPKGVSFLFRTRSKGYLSSTMIGVELKPSVYEKPLELELERNKRLDCPGSKDRATVVSNDGVLVLENDFNGQRYRCSVLEDDYFCEFGDSSKLKHWERFDCSYSGESLLEFCLKEHGSKVTLNTLFLERSSGKVCIMGEKIFNIDMVSFPKRDWNVYCPLECEIL